MTIMSLFDPKGEYFIEHYDKDGNLKGKYRVENGITNQGKNKILDCMFNASSQIAAASWYAGLISNAGSPSLAAADTLASHAGWTEFTNYSGNRPAWGQGAASGQAVTNASQFTFNITATGTLYGLLICSVNTGGTGSDILWSTAAFPETVPVSNGDQMKGTYTLAT